MIKEPFGPIINFKKYFMVAIRLSMLQIIIIIIMIMIIIIVIVVIINWSYFTWCQTFAKCSLVIDKFILIKPLIGIELVTIGIHNLLLW